MIVKEKRQSVNQMEGSIKICLIVSNLIHEFLKVTGS